VKAMERGFHGKQPMNVSVTYTEMGTREVFELEGRVVAHFVKVWNKEEEEERCLLNYWYAPDPFTRKHEDGTIDYVEYDDLSPAAFDEIEWVICASLDA